MTERIFNFSAGPAVLPVPVLEKAREEMLSLRDGGSADYIITGSWGKKAIKEAKKHGTVNVAADMADSGYNRVPGQDELKLDAGAAYVHMTSNETIEGVEWKHDPEVGDVPLVCDASSDICSRPVDVSKYALIYAGAQKNLGPSGVTVVILREDLLARIPDGLDTMLDYRTHAKADSLYNTPNTWGIYILDLVCKWAKEQGGLDSIHQRNQGKARKIYDVIDSTDFYRGHAAREARSIMNVTFRLPSEELEKKFTAEATAQGLDGLKGHRSVGGIRASIYNAFPVEGVDALVQFMREFERANG